MDKYEFTKNVINELLKKTNKVCGNESNEIKNSFMKDNYVHLALIFTGTNIGLKYYVNELVKLKRYGFTYDIVLSRAAEGIINLDILKVQLAPNKIYKDDMIYDLGVFDKYDGVIVPMMTQNTLTKIVLGLQDNFITSLIWHMFWFNKPVFIDFTNCRTKMGFETRNSFLKEMIENYLVKLIKMGAIEIDKKDFIVKILDKFRSYKSVAIQTKEDVIDAEFDGVITEKDVISIAKEQKEIIVSARTIITPLAKDTAKKLGLKIRKK